MWNKILNGNKRTLKRLDKAQGFDECELSTVVDKIFMYFREDINILEINAKVITKIERDILIGKRYADDILLVEVSMCYCKDDHSRLNVLIQEKKRLKSLIKQKYSEVRLSDYQSRVESILDRYKHLRPSEEFPLSRGKNYIPSDRDLARIKVIRDFYILASEFMEIDYFCTGQVPELDDDVCKNCLSPLPTHDGIKLETRVCRGCYVVNTIVPKYRPVSKIDENGILTTKSDDTVTFVRALEHYEGRITNVQAPRERLYPLLDVYFPSIGLPTRDTIHSHKLNERGHREGTCIRDMITAFKAVKYEAYNEIYFVVVDYWQYTPINISSIRDLCIADRREFITAWNSFTVNERGRKSSISIWLCVWFHTRNRGHPCQLEDFKLPVSYQDSIVLIGRVCKRCTNPEIQMPD